MVISRIMQDKVDKIFDIKINRIEFRNKNELDEDEDYDSMIELHFDTIDEVREITFNQLKQISEIFGTSDIIYRIWVDENDQYDGYDEYCGTNKTIYNYLEIRNPKVT